MDNDDDKPVLPAGRYLVTCDHISAYAETRSGKPGPNYCLTLVVRDGEHYGATVQTYFWLSHSTKGTRYRQYLDMLGCEYIDGNELEPTNFWEREVYVSIRYTFQGFAEVFAMEPKMVVLPPAARPPARPNFSRHLEGSNYRNRNLPLADELPMHKGGYK
jgi:hypothetical protein